MTFEQTGSDRRSPLPAEPGYEIRDLRDSTDDRPSIEAWITGGFWPVVRALRLEYSEGWFVLVDPAVAEVAGLGYAHVSAVDAINADHAFVWVNLLAGLYAKAVAK